MSPYYDYDYYSSTEPSHEADLHDLLVGKSVVFADKERGEVTLNDGTVLVIEPVDSCCAWYEIKRLVDVENIITAVEVEHIDADYRRDTPEIFRVFVYSGNTKINMLSVEGSEGSGYYGQGYYLYVKETNA